MEYYSATCHREETCCTCKGPLGKGIAEFVRKDGSLHVICATCHTPESREAGCVYEAKRRIWPPEVLGDTWGKTLGRMISGTEGRIAGYKAQMQAAYKAGDRETIADLREAGGDEESWLKKLRAEKTAWNESLHQDECDKVSYPQERAFIHFFKFIEWLGTP